MGSLTLLDRARAAGLSVTADGDRLIIKGPRRAEPMARALKERKAEVLALLAAGPAERWGPESDAAPESLAERSALEAGAPVGPPASIGAVGPADHLCPLIQARRDPADRRVETPRGPGNLWQVFARRVGVVLDATPTKVTFFDDPRRVTMP